MRFDAHCGVMNATIRNSKIGFVGINAIGWGTFLVEDSTVYGRCFFNLRSDCGSTWDGEFVVRNCTYVPACGKTACGVLKNIATASGERLRVSPNDFMFKDVKIERDGMRKWKVPAKSPAGVSSATHSNTLTFNKTEIWYNGGVADGNGFWKVCEVLDCELRLELLRYLIDEEKTEFPCVNELAEKFQVSAAAMSIHLKKLATVGLVVSKRAERRVYYRAFATTAECERVLASFRRIFKSSQNAERICRLREYAHALSHPRRHLIARCLYEEPGLSLAELALRTEMPPQTADRLRGELGKAHIADMNGVVIVPESEPEATLLELTMA